MTKTELHRRICYSCGHHDEYADGVSPACDCKNCGSADTRRTDRLNEQKKADDQLETVLRGFIDIGDEFIFEERPEVAEDFIRAYCLLRSTLANRSLANLRQYVADAGGIDAIFVEASDDEIPPTGEVPNQPAGLLSYNGEQIGEVIGEVIVDDDDDYRLTPDICPACGSKNYSESVRFEECRDCDYSANYPSAY
jgi:hypothetical protein